MPVKKVSPNLSGKTNIQILNAIRKNASSDYQRRIPNATKANIEATIQTLMSYTPGRNEFADALINKIGLSISRNQLWENPWNEFKLGMLLHGESIEEIQVGLVTAQVYNAQTDYLEKDIFGRKEIDVQASYHTVNRRNFYAITIDEPILAQAFLDPMGLSKFVAQLMDAPATSDNWDEFLLMCSLFSTYYNSGGFFKVNVPDVKGLTSDAADSKAALRAIIEMAETLPFISPHYNASGMPLAAKAEDLVLFVSPAFKAAIGVEALAAAFNLSYTDIPTRMFTVPEEHMAITGAQAILTTKDFFVVADQRYESTSAPNPVGLYQNYFLHHWQVVSASLFVPAILFTSTEPTTVIGKPDTPVTSMSPITFTDITGATVTDLERGQSYVVNVDAITTPVGGENVGVLLEIEGNDSPRTWITQGSVIRIGIDESNTPLVLTATSLDNPAISSTVSAKIVGDYVKWFPNPAVIPDADKDGLSEVTPEAPTKTGTKITVPATTGAIYKNGATVVTGKEIDGSATVTIVATAAPKFELASGAVATWTFTV